MKGNGLYLFLNFGERMRAGRGERQTGCYDGIESFFRLIRNDFFRPLIELFPLLFFCYIIKMSNPKFAFLKAGRILGYYGLQVGI